jgi:UDP-glucose 4-epimerase
MKGAVGMASDRHWYLVTGGAGFIGSHLVEALAAQGHRVRVLDNLSSGFARNLEHIAGEVELVMGDIRFPDQVAGAMQDVECVFHEAAMVSAIEAERRPLENHEINITGTLNILEACRMNGLRRIVLASSAAVYGAPPILPMREDMSPAPESPFAAAKLAAEHYARVYHGMFGLETVALRCFHVYGPRQDPSPRYSGVISKFSDALLKKQAPVIFGDGGQTRDFVFVQDVVQAHLKAMEAPAAAVSGRVFNVGTGRRASLLEALGALEALAGRAGPPPEFRAARAGDVRDSLSDITAAREAFGYAPAFDLRGGLRALWEQMTAPRAMKNRRDDA